VRRQNQDGKTSGVVHVLRFEVPVVRYMCFHVVKSHSDFLTELSRYHTFMSPPPHGGGGANIGMSLVFLFGRAYIKKIMSPGGVVVWAKLP